MLAQIILHQKKQECPFKMKLTISFFAFIIDGKIGYIGFVPDSIFLWITSYRSKTLLKPGFPIIITIALISTPTYFSRRGGLNIENLFITSRTPRAHEVGYSPQSPVFNLRCLKYVRHSIILLWIKVARKRITIY